jgi:AmiR/NasT family two-component response regulator
LTVESNTDRVVKVAMTDELARAQDRIRHLETALETNRHIAMAIGIVMARYGLPEPEAFDVLRRTSQRVHRKLRDLAEEIVYTGEVPPCSDAGTFPARVVIDEAGFDDTDGDGAGLSG